MKIQPIYKYIYALIFSGLCMQSVASTTPTSTDSLKTKASRSYASKEEARTALEKYNGIPLLNGFSVGVDLLNPVIKGFVSWSQYEISTRLNLHKTYFPIFEIGIGKSNHTNDDTFINYQVKSPYYRLGVDINFAKNKNAYNYIFGGIRYGFSSYDYSINGPNVIDPNWGTSVPYSMNNLHGSKHWVEIIFGLETRIWKMIHLNWNFKYKTGIAEKSSQIGKPWYVPGYGTNKNGTLGGSFNLIIDFSRK